MSEKKVVICLPAYKAERTLAKTVADIPKGVASELILVDDASPDNTVKVAKKLGLRTIVHKSNKGYGGNQKTCYKYALADSADIVVLLHPDYQYDPKVIPDLIRPIKEGRAEFTFGSRFINGRDPLRGGMPLYRYLGNRITTFFENLFLGTRFSELHSGLKAYSRKFLESVPYSKYSDKFVFDSEMLIDAILNKTKMVEVAIPTHFSDDSSSASFSDCLVYVSQTFMVLFKKKIERLVRRADLYRAKKFADLFLDFISNKEKVVDIGAGSCLIAELVQKKGNKVTPCDIIDYNRTKLTLKLYDGKKLPFADNSFDTALLVSVLHHTKDPTLTLSEAKRVSKKLIIVEDIYNNIWDKILLKFNDFLFNVPFGRDLGQHFYTDSEWKKIFQKHGLKLKNERGMRSSLGLAKIKSYYLEN